MRLVHISDIHYTAESNHERVREALYADLKKIEAQGSISVVILTGDFFNKGNSGATEVSAVKKIPEEIRKATNKNVIFVICPGNHDVNLRARDPLLDPIFEGVKTPADANKLVVSANKDSSLPLFTHLDGFLALAAHIDPESYQENRLFYTKTVIFDGVKIGFASFNSAWMTRGGGTQDYGKLFIGQNQIDTCLNKIRDCSIKIALTHHTLEWLDVEEQANIRRLLAANFDALFCGHNHDNVASLLSTNTSSIFTSNTGCLYQSLEYFNGYSIIDMQYQQRLWSVSAREFYFQRNEFDIAPRFADMGNKEYPFFNRSGTTEVMIPTSALLAAQQHANSKLLSFSASDIAPKQVGAIFVCPPLARMSEKKLVAKESIPNARRSEYLSLQDLVVDQKNVLIIGKKIIRKIRPAAPYCNQ